MFIIIIIICIIIITIIIVVTIIIVITISCCSLLRFSADPICPSKLPYSTFSANSMK